MSDARRRTAEGNGKQTSVSGNLHWLQLRLQLRGNLCCAQTWKLLSILHCIRQGLIPLVTQKRMPRLHYCCPPDLILSSLKEYPRSGLAKPYQHDSSLALN